MRRPYHFKCRKGNRFSVFKVTEPKHFKQNKNDSWTNVGCMRLGATQSYSAGHIGRKHQVRELQQKSG